MQLNKLASSLVVLVGVLDDSVSTLLSCCPENIMITTLKGGNLTITLRPDLASKYFVQINMLVHEVTLTAPSQVVLSTSVASSTIS